MAKSEKRSPFARFRAELLYVLQPFVEHHRLQDPPRFLDGNIFVEPASAGGAIIGAVSGHAMAILHDPDAYCAGAAMLDIPDAAFDAACPVAPLHMSYCGDCYEAEMPEWMQPGDVMFSEAGMFITPRARHPQWADEDEEFAPVLYARTASVKVHSVGVDYKMKSGSPVDWKKVLAKAVSTPPGSSPDTTVFMPQIANLYSRIVEMCMEEAMPEGCAVFHRTTRAADKPGPIIITISGRPDFVGTYMPMKDGTTQPVSWHFLHKEKSDG